MPKMGKRKSRPNTSRKAAERNRPHSEYQRRQVAIALMMPSTREEVQEFLNLGGSSVRPRVVELMEKGYIGPTGETRETHTGSLAEVLALTDAGVEYIAEVLQ